MPCKCFVPGNMYREDRSGQVIKVSQCWNDSPSESAMVVGEVLSPGRYKDPENGTGNEVRFAFKWDAWSPYVGPVPVPPYQEPDPTESSDPP